MDHQAKNIKNRGGGEVSFIYPNTHDFVKAMQRQNENNYREDNFYFRGGFKRLMDLEVKITKLLGLDGGRLALTTAGMSAVVTALEIAALSTGDVVIHGKAEYGQIDYYISENLKERGVVPILVNFGDLNEIKKTLEKYGNKVKVIFAETVGNGPTMPVLDLKGFFNLEILKKIDPLIILDNTLPTNSIIQLGALLKNVPLKVIGLESATKFYLFNKDLGGILFTFSDDIFLRLLKRRTRTGATPGPSLVKTFEGSIPQSKEEFDRDNKQTVRNTLSLARAASEAKGSGTKFEISYPNLPGHPNYDYVKNNYSDGIAIAFFITASKNSGLTSE